MPTLLTTLLMATISFSFSITQAAQVSVVHEFPKPTWLENIASMRNGSLLVSVIGKPEVYLVNPLSKPSTSPLIANIPTANAVLGMTELSDDVFAVAAGNVTPANVPIPGSWSVWSIDLSNKHSAALVSKLVDTPHLGMINGLAALNKHTLLLADSWTGDIVSVDTRTGATGVWLKDASTAPNFSAPGLPLGVNGVKVHREWVYYTNTVRNELNRVRADTSTGEPVGKVETLARGDAIAVPDDFAVLEDGSVVLGRPMGDELVKVGSSGKVEVVANVEGVTAAAIGDKKKGRGVVYLSSMGGYNTNGTVKMGGRIVAVDLA